MRPAQIRIARPTFDREALVAFYREGLGLELLGRFNDHQGYSGVILGTADRTLQLEFTTHDGQKALPAPTSEHLLVLYFDDPIDYQNVNRRLQRLGHIAVAPQNPYWEARGTTYEDPDGWRIVVFNGTF